MGLQEKVAKLLTEEKDGKIRETEITQDELDQIFFGEGNREWDQIQTVLPEPVWEKIYEDGYVLYEGYTIDSKAFGAGKAFYKNGSPNAEGIFGLKGLLCGREYYSNGKIRFEGVYRLNQGYGPNYPDFGSWYDETGKLKYRGKIHIGRSSLGWPMVMEPQGFFWQKSSQIGNHTFMWEDARKYMKQAIEKSQDPNGISEGL